MVNRYAGVCTGCNARVPAGQGVCFKLNQDWRVRHTQCGVNSGGASVTTLVGERGRVTMSRNVRGRCEDAPCCGCCD